MKKELQSFILIVVLLLTTSLIFGQNTIVLQHRTKQKHISLDRYLIIKTIDSTYYRKIIFVSDTTITGVGKWRKDTISIPIKDIRLIKKEWFKNNTIAGVGGYILIFSSVILVVGVPIEWATEGKKAALQTLTGAAYSAAVALPFIIIGSGKKTYNMKKNGSLSKPDIAFSQTS